MTDAPASDDSFLHAFRRCELQPAEFDHRAHVRVAWLLLNRYPLEVAVEEMCWGLAQLAARFGAPEKFNRTVTEALVRLIAHGGATRLTWDAFVRANTVLMTDARALLREHYSDERLFSPLARAHFMTPDRTPLRA